jgi:hypothetical protein
MSDKNKNDLVSTWMEVGRMWSKYGRSIGKVALESVAEALKKTAEAMDSPDKNPAAKPERSGAEPASADKPADKAPTAKNE